MSPTPIEPALIEPALIEPALIEVEALVSGYGEVVALHGVTASVEAGSITALLGSNGAGKSTFLKTVAGLLRPSAGSIRLEGAEIASSRSSERVARGVVLVPEGRWIFPAMSVEENLRIGAFTPHARRGSAGQLEEIYAMFPRLRERRRQQGGTLSGGEQQMLAIGRGLMARPRILLLDEPTLGLAPLMAEAIFDAVAALKDRGLTVLLAEQDVRRTLVLADRGYVLESGRLVMSGTGADLLADPRINAAYLGI